MPPLGVTTQAAYSIGNDQSGHRRFVTTMTDPNGNVTTQYADYGGRKVQVTDSINGATRTTLMHYDNLGQLDSVSDPEGFKTTYSYDMLGRMTKRIHPDAGETRYTYDNAGNLTKEINPLGQILYDYTYYRLLKKRYSSMTGNDVTYTYGTSGTETGRPVRIVDGSGMYECRYDALGNVTDETRTIALPQHGEVYRFRMLYRYDSWGRMLAMTYPDGEKVNYTYQWGGDLHSMHSEKSGNHRVYVSKILYNTFGQRSQVEYGNQTKAYYTYDALHRLVKLKSRNGSGTLMQDISYTFDSASNVTGITNTAGIVNSLGGGYANSYRYDALHRLVWSSGGGAMGSYSMDMGYTPSGRIGEKNRLTHLGTFSETVETIYGYCDTYQPHAVRRIYDRAKGIHHDLRWDGAGNLGQVSAANESAIFESGRFLYWTEDSRMHAAVDDRYYSYYAYDHGGERRLKLTGDNKLLDVNANFMATYTILNEQTLYPSAYMVVNSKGYTKHYYAGAERVAARIGGGGLDALISLADGGDSLRTKASHLFTQSIGQVNNRVLENNEPDCITGSVAEQDELKVWIKGIPEQLQASTLIDYGEFTDVIQSLRADHNGGQEREVYFYHSDHLGSASWITDSGGQAIQHLQYLPYGEPYINQRTSGYNERYTFTGKERDEETGYGYFGARYMDHELTSMWLSVDPMADKYPSISPYTYCAWNPIIAIDPSGMDSVHTPNGIANVGDGYRATPDGKYLYGEGLQPKRWNPNLEIGGIVGDGFRGGYENCDESELPLIHNEKIINLANNAIPVAVPIGAFLWEQLSTAAGTAIEAFAAIAWIIPACLLVSSDTRPNQNVQEGNNFGENNVAETKENMYHPFAHDTKKNGKLKGGRSDRHAAQYNHGGKRRSPNPNQRKGAQERRNKGKQIN